MSARPTRRPTAAAPARRSGTVRVEAAFALALIVLVGACSDATGPTGSVSILAPASTEITVGDGLTLQATSSGVSGTITWTASDTAIAGVQSGVIEARRPGSVTITASLAGATPADVALTIVARPGGYSADEVDYFAEIAFGSEFGGASTQLRRWAPGPTLRVNGTATAADSAALDAVIAEINAIVPGLGLTRVSDDADVEVHFVPQSQFTSVLPQAPAGNVGVVWVWWGPDQVIYESVVLISTEIALPLRAHIIREEVTQMLGLLRDSFRYPLSIFYQGPSQVTAYQPIDRTVIELLYRPELAPGVGVHAAVTTVRGLTRAGLWMATGPEPQPALGGRGDAGG